MGSSDVSIEKENTSQDETIDYTSRVKYRKASPTDTMLCYELEKASYPPEERATKNSLQYRQHHAASYFRCAVLEDEDGDEDENVIVGFICSTRCDPIVDDDISTSHKHNGPLLSIRSIVVNEAFRRKGLGTDMLKNYIETIRSANATAENPISKLIIYAQKHLLTYLIHCGFSVIRPAKAIEGRDQRYLLELSLQSTNRNQISDRAFNTITPKAGRECYVVDSFAAMPGTGNPAAVVLLPQETDSEKLAAWMQKVAAEFNLSETAFCWPKNQTESISKELHWSIRYFTPKIEVPLCGHATLAAAAVLYQTIRENEGFRIVFHAREDSLTMELSDEPVSEQVDIGTTRISMHFPAKPPRELETREEKSAVKKMLESAFQCALDPLFVGISEIGDVLVELTPENFNEIGYERLDFKALFEWDGYYRGVIICCQCDESLDSNNPKEMNPDFLSRFFGPKAGINEDPVTGSAHCVLGPYFSKKLNKDKVVGKQTSARGGIVQCSVANEKVRLTGTAITTLSGTLWL